MSSACGTLKSSVAYTLCMIYRCLVKPGDFTVQRLPLTVWIFSALEKEPILFCVAALHLTNASTHQASCLLKVEYLLFCFKSDKGSLGGADISIAVVSYEECMSLTLRF